MTSNIIDKLTEDLGSKQRADELLSTVERLQTWDAPQPTPADTARIFSALQNQHPISNIQSRKSSIRYPMILLRAQLYVVRREILAASALVIGIGTMLSFVSLPGNGALPDGTTAPGGLALALIAPIVAALGVSFLYGPGIDPVVEIEESTPVSQRQILLARLTLIFGFNLIAGLTGSLLLAIAGIIGLIPMPNFFSLVSIWLAPMTALSALAFLLTVISGDPLAGTAISMTIWAAQAFRTFGDPVDSLFHFPDLLSAQTRPWLWAAAFVLGALAFWLAGREGQVLRKQA